MVCARSRLARHLPSEASMPIVKRTGLAVLWIATLVSAGWLGARVASSPVQVAAAPSSAVVKVVEPAVSAMRAPVSAAELRSIVRDELARQRADEHGPPSEPDPEPVATPQDARPLSPELQVRADEAAALIERAIAAGRWTSDDREKLGNSTQGLPPLKILELH